MAATKEQADEAVAALGAGLDGVDLIAYWGGLRRPHDDRMIAQCGARRLRKHCILWIATRGGDPNVAYRIARCLQRVYRTQDSDPATKGSVTVFVNSICKSAGTLLALGADRLVMSGEAELGPIDIQLRKPEEVGEQTSGLTPIQALMFLRTHSGELFEHYFRKLRFDEELAFSTKMAADIATNLTVGLLGSIYGQIDPMRVAEVDRLLKIAAEYGERIGKSNLKDGALTRLLAQYPSHTFVIDSKEAGEIFKVVEEPSAHLRIVADHWGTFADYSARSSDRPWVFFFGEEPAVPAPAEPAGGGGAQ
jgi:hypothetical protein